MTNPWINYATTLAILLATLGLLVSRSSWAARNKQRLTAYFSGVALLAMWSYSNFGAFHRPAFEFVHGWDMFHYYVSAKYFPELGYDKFYGALLHADAERPEPRLGGINQVRDPMSYELVRARKMRRNPHFVEEFSKGRWDAFRSDVEYFVDLYPTQNWKWFFRDHGYNAPPSRTALSAPIASVLGRANDSSVLAIALLDPLLLGVLFIAIARAYSLRTASLVIIAFGTSKLANFNWIGGSFMRFDWFVLTGLGVTALGTRRHFLAGALLGGAAMLRLFPAFFALGVVLRGLYTLYQTHRFEKRYVQFSAGLCAAAIALFALSFISGGGAPAWVEFFQKIARHSGGAYANHVGLLAVVGDSHALLWFARAVVVGLFLAALPRIDDVQAALLGGVLIFSFGFIAGYYYSMLALFWLWRREIHFDTGAIAFYVLLFIPSLVIMALEDPTRLTMESEHHAASLALFIAFGALFWWIFDSARVRVSSRETL